jgi:hypothetical protein
MENLNNLDNQMVVYATKAKIGKALNNQELIINNFCG